MAMGPPHGHIIFRKENPALKQENQTNYLVCIDDTDMPGTKGTGWLVQELCKELVDENRTQKCSPISRHQLYVHEDIPYTSHNSSMCFEMILKADMKSAVSYMAQFLENRSQTGSDPGLCVAGITPALDWNRLIEYGKFAKNNISSKQEAYDLAADAGIHLSEHGGTGQGVVGAVAGLGLRLSGDDGRYRGWYHLGMPGDVVSVKSLCRYPFIDELVTESGKILPMGGQVQIGSAKTKIVRVKSRQALVVKPETGNGVTYRTITRQEAKAY